MVRKAGAGWWKCTDDVSTIPRMRAFAVSANHHPPHPQGLQPHCLQGAFPPPSYKIVGPNSPPRASSEQTWQNAGKPLLAIRKKLGPRQSPADGAPPPPPRPRHPAPRGGTRIHACALAGPWLRASVLVSAGFGAGPETADRAAALRPPLPGETARLHVSRHGMRASALDSGGRGADLQNG